MAHPVIVDSIARPDIDAFPASCRRTAMTVDREKPEVESFHP